MHPTVRYAWETEENDDGDDEVVRSNSINAEFWLF